MYHLKIHDGFFVKKIRSITAAYGPSPCCAQLHFQDVDTAINYRLQEHFNQTCKNNTLREISLELERSNPFLRSFIAMKHHCQRVKTQNKELYMLIKVNYELYLRLSS